MALTLQQKALAQTLVQKVMRKTPLHEVGKQVGGGKLDMRRLDEDGVSWSGVDDQAKGVLVLANAKYSIHDCDVRA